MDFTKEGLLTSHVVDGVVVIGFSRGGLRDEREILKTLESLGRYVDSKSGLKITLDLSNVAARRELFEQLSARAKAAIVVSEGLVVYLAPEEVLALAADLARTPTFNRWALDMVSPALMRMMLKTMGQELQHAGAPFKFAPDDGPAFFERAGWKPLEVRSLLHTAATLKRLSWRMRLFALLPDSAGRVPSSPWGGVCLFEKIY